MADVWPLHGDGQRFENAGDVEATTSLTDIPENAANNLKGAWAELIAASAFDASGFLLNSAFTPASQRSMLIDIGVGAAGSETVILSNFMMVQNTSASLVDAVYIPIGIPAGSRVAARYQITNITTANLMVAVTLIGAGFLGGSPYGNAETWGATTADSGGIQVVPGVSNAKGSYAEIVATTARDTNAIIICIGNSAGDYALVGSRHMFDIAIGAAASETILLGNLLVMSEATSDSFYPRTIGPIPCMIPAGSRVAVRGQTAAATTDNFDFVIIGFSL